MLAYVSSMDFSDKLLDSRIEWVHSPVACLSAATQNAYHLITVIFTGSTRHQTALVELCTALKNTPNCSRTPVAALVTKADRRLIEPLEDARIDYVKQIQWPTEAIYNDLQALTLLDRPIYLLGRLCLSIHYKPINKHQDLIVCAAYRYRMVLGSRLLRQLCETREHANCQYLLSASKKSDQYKLRVTD